jgi:hypothetical protein
VANEVVPQMSRGRMDVHEAAQTEATPNIEHLNTKRRSYE